ncbi:MAG: hypothetical protein NC222_06400 [Staphylococcus sp.]|nr:hypothetical protein [Staphylococcus sp.]
MAWTKLSSIKKTAGSVTIDIEDYIDSLSERIDEAINRWGGEEHEELKEQFLDYCREVFDGQQVPSVSVVADNWVVNGEFISKDEWAESYDKAFKQYEGNWEEFCQNEGIIYDDRFCCIRLGF